MTMGPYLVREVRAAHMADLFSQLVRTMPASRVSGSYAWFMHRFMVVLPEIFH